MAIFSLGSLVDKDISRYSAGTSTFSNVQDLTNVETAVNLLTYSKGILKTQNGVTQNTAIISNYVDGTDGNVLSINNSTVTPFTITRITCAPNYFVISGENNVTGQDVGGSGYLRVNMDLGATNTSYIYIKLVII